MGLATRGIGPGTPVPTFGLGPGYVPLILNATASPGVIQLIVAMPQATASEVPDFELDLNSVFTGRDHGVLTRHDALALVSQQNRKDIMADYIYRQDQDGPPIGFRWLDYTKQLLDFTSGWTFELVLVTYEGVIQSTVDNTNITGGPGDTVQPNVVIDWPAAFFTAIPVDQYLLQLKATETATSKGRVFSLDRLPTLEVVPALTVAP